MILGVNLPIHVRLFVISWTVACQAFLFFTISWSLFKHMPIESEMPSNHLILGCPLLFPPSIFPSISIFPVSWPFTSDGQSIGTSATASILPMNMQSCFPLGLTVSISLQSNGLLEVFSHTTFQKHQFSSNQPSLWSNSHIHTVKTLALAIQY